MTCGSHRRHLRPARRPAAGHRAGRGAHPRVAARTDLGAPERPVPAADRRLAHGAAAPADPARPSSTGATTCCSTPSSVSSSGSRCSRADATSPRPKPSAPTTTIAADDVADLVQALVDKSLVIAQATRRHRALHAAADAVAIRPREARRARRRQAHARCHGRALRAAVRAEQGCVHGSDAARVAARRRQSNTTTCAPRSSGRIANDDAETALVIAGGASWSHWLTGTAAEGARWLDDAFACAGAVTDQTRALALAGRGLLRFDRRCLRCSRRRPTRGARNVPPSRRPSRCHLHSHRSTARPARLTGRLEEARARRLQALDRASRSARRRVRRSRCGPTHERSSR